jgi:hypothetical protein
MKGWRHILALIENCKVKNEKCKVGKKDLELIRK